MDDLHSTITFLKNSPKGRLVYSNGWDENPNAITGLIAAVQETEIDKPNRNILNNAFQVFNPRPSPCVKSRRNTRHSFPENLQPSSSSPKNTSTPVSPSFLSNFIRLKVEHDGKNTKRLSDPTFRKDRLSDADVIRRLEPRIEVEEVDEWSSDPGAREFSSRQKYPGDDFAGNRLLLTPPTRLQRRKKSVEGSPIFKPSPTFSSSTLTQTHSSTTSASDATSATPTRTSSQHHVRVGKSLGIHDVPYDEEKLEEDLVMESKISPFNYIEKCLAKYDEDVEQKIRKVEQERIEKLQEALKEAERRAEEVLAAELKAHKEISEVIKRELRESERSNLQEIQIQQQQRQKLEEQLQHEREAAATAAEKRRKAAQEVAEKEEQLRIAKIKEEQRRKEQEDAAKLEKERQEKAAEEKRLADEVAAVQQKANEEKKKQEQVVPELSGLILRDDLMKYAKVNEIMKLYEDPVAHIDGKDPATKGFYIGAVKCINTPLNALADTQEHEIMKKVEHFSKLLSGQPVSGGGSMTTMFSCKSITNGEFFVMKTLAFRFVKKSEADVTRGKSTVQPLATVGVHLAIKFPAWATLVQGNMYKLCPFLVPFSYPQGDKSIQQYARELGHELSGTETAIQQTFLERLKGYCTLYALMVLRFHRVGSFDVGEATEFFTLGGAWQIIAKTIKLEPQVDVTATVIHTLLDILDDTLYAVYKTQFAKLMRLLILTYLPKIKNITPPAKSGSVSRLQIYLEKKFAV